MQDLMKMMESLFEGLSGNNSPKENAETESANSNSRVRQACRAVLSGMKCEINAMEHMLIALDAKRDALIDEYNALVREVKGMNGDSESEKVPTCNGKSDQADDLNDASQSAEKIDQDNEANGSSTQTEVPVPPWLREKVAEDESVTKLKRGRKPQEKVEPEFKRLPVHRATGNLRLDVLEMALHDTLERLNNSKMAYHFMTIKEVRLALNELYKSWDKPENERIAELEVGLKACFVA